MKRKYLAILLVLALAFTLVACGDGGKEQASSAETSASETSVSQASEASTGSTSEASSESTSTSTTGKYKPGTYQASAQGRGGDIKVSVTFTEDRIESVVIDEQNETANLAEPALEGVPKQIVDNQSLGVDAISGVTITADAIVEAVSKTVEEAGGDVEALKNVPITVQAEKLTEIDETYDVVILGGGGAGMSAANAAIDQGATVVVVEKAAALGGNTIRAGGAYNAVDADRQKAVDMEASQITELKEILAVKADTIHEEYRETLTNLQKEIQEYLAGDTTKLFDSVNLHTYQTYLGGLRKAMDGTEIYGQYDLVSTLTSRSLETLEWVGEIGNTGISDEISTVLGGLWPRMHSLTAPVGTGYITPLAARIESKGAKIYLNVEATELIMEDGKCVGVIAKQADGTKATFHANKGVVVATGGYGSNAQMAVDYDTYWGVLNKDMKTTNAPSITGDGILMGKEAGAELVGMGFVQLMPSSDPLDGGLGGGVWGPADQQVFVNKEGKRFVSEYESRDVLAKAALSQTDSMFFIIGDQVGMGDPKLGGTNIWGDDIDKLLADKRIFKGDTIEELAAQMGVDANALQETVDRYNEFIKNGKDEDFGKVKLGDAIDVGPFWATPRSPSIHHTMGGLKIDVDAHVIDTKGEVIPGLYAAGEVTGGIHAGNRVGGNALPDIMVFGNIAGTNAAQGK